MYFAWGDVNLSRPAPHCDGTGSAARALEVANVLAQRFDHVCLRPPLLDVGAVQAFDILGIEDRAHGAYRRHLVLDELEVLAAQHLSVRGALVSVVGEQVPGSETELIEAGERNEVFDERRAVVGAFAEPDRRQLGQRPDGRGESPPREKAPRDERRRDGTEPGEQDAELSVSGLNLRGSLHVVSSVGAALSNVARRGLECACVWSAHSTPAK